LALLSVDQIENVVLLIVLHLLLNLLNNEISEPDDGLNFDFKNQLDEF
jgi:hypothetical protein